MFFKEHFVGREDIIKLIDKRLQGLKEGYRQNIAILGGELIGKSWVIKFIFDNYCDTKIIPLYFDLSQPIVDIFTQRFFSAILFNFLKAKNILLPKGNLNSLIEEAKKHIPNTTSKIQEISSRLEKEKFDTTAFRDIFSLLEIIHQESGQKIVVIFDEFQNLESLKIRNVFQEFGKKIMMQKNTMYIVLSSSKTKARKIIQDELSLLFGNFEIIDIASLNNKDSGALIRNELKDIHMPAELSNFLINFTGGHPFYLNKITQHIYQKVMVKKALEINKFLFIESLEDALFDNWGVLNLRFQSYIDLLNSKNKSDALNMLLLIAQGKNRMKDLSSHLHKNYRDINQKLSFLIESDIISRAGSFYNINDRVFNFWLNFVYLEKLNNLSQSYQDQVESFRRKIEQSLFEFIEASKKDISQRIHDLFILFSGDSVQLGRNKFLLSRFKEIKPLNFNGHNIKKGFICTSDQECWLIGFKEGNVTEDCVSEFVKESEKSLKLEKEKTSKRLIIGLTRPEINASLLAKEEKIATWDINHLNTLLDLYGKPRLIV